MKFAELLAEDNEAVLDVEEFGEYILLGGVILKAQLESWTAKVSSREDRNFVGLHGDFVTAYFKVADYFTKKAKLPKQGEWVYVNGKRYEVQSCKDDLGVATLILKTYRQGVKQC